MEKISVPQHIFRSSDIRGKVETDLFPEIVTQLGAGVGTLIRSTGESRVVLGHDNRPSSPGITENFIKGLQSAGCEVIEFGMIPTPLLYFAATKDGPLHGVMITGSHLDIEQNGIKLCYGAKTLHKEIGAIKGIVEQGEFVAGKGSRKADDGSDLFASYLERIQRDIRLDHPLKIVVDCQNGAASEIAAKIFRELGCEVTAIHCDKEKPYPFKNPDPQIPENLSVLRETVLKNNADIGIAFDGDGDRLGVVDENGDHVPADKILVLLAEEILKQHPGAKVVYDVLCSQTLVDKINAAGGVPLVSKSGHAYVKDLLLEHHALLGGEYSGHIFFADNYYGFDDGLYAAARVLDLLGRAKSTLSVLVSSIPKSYSSPEFRPTCPDDLKSLIVEEIKERFISAGLAVSDVDGARVVFGHGWGIIRASGTEPKLSIRIEADSEERLAEYQYIFIGYLTEAGQKHQIGFEAFN